MPTPHRKISDTTIKTAFLLIAAGGTGRHGALWLRQYTARGEASPFPHEVISIDTDQASEAHDPGGRRVSLIEAVDEHVDIALTRGDISRITANPDRFGRVASILVGRHRHLLEPEALKHGSRTTRMITQLAVICHIRRVFAALGAGAARLDASGEIQAIQPVVMASSGGGCGSALLTLLPLYLTDPRSLQAFAPNLAHKVQKPILLVAEPYALAAANDEDASQCILGNAKATRLEVALLSRAQRVLLALRLGQGNDQGTRFDRPADVHAALGAKAFMLASEFGYLVARGVDTFLKDLHTRRYNGHDVPEAHIPAELWPPYAVAPPRRRPRPEVPHVDFSFRRPPATLPPPGHRGTNGSTPKGTLLP